MSGLVYKNLRLGQGIVSLWNVVLMVIGAAFLGIVIPWEVFFVVVTYLLAGGVALLSLAHVNHGDDRNWQKLEAVMPLETWKIVLSKYLSHAILYGVVVLPSLVYAAVNYASGGLDGVCHCLMEYAGNCGCRNCNCILAFVMRTLSGTFFIFIAQGAFVIPLHLILPSDKAMYAIYGGVIAAVLTVVLLGGIFFVLGVSTFAYTLVMLSWISLMVMLYVASYCFSLGIYRGKSF